MIQHEFLLYGILLLMCNALYEANKDTIAAIITYIAALSFVVIEVVITIGNCCLGK